MQVNCTDPRQSSSLAHCTALGPPGTFDCFYRGSVPSAGLRLQCSALGAVGGGNWKCDYQEF